MHSKLKLKKLPQLLKLLLLQLKKLPLLTVQTLQKALKSLLNVQKPLLQPLAKHLLKNTQLTNLPPSGCNLKPAPLWGQVFLCQKQFPSP
jgi:hypothetical protein